MILTDRKFAGDVDLFIFDGGYASCWPSDVKCESASPRTTRQPHGPHFGGIYCKIDRNSREKFFEISEPGRNTIRERRWKHLTTSSLFDTRDL